MKLDLADELMSWLEDKTQIAASAFRNNKQFTFMFIYISWCFREDQQWQQPAVKSSSRGEQQGNSSSSRNTLQMWRHAGWRWWMHLEPRRFKNDSVRLSMRQRERERGGTGDGRNRCFFGIMNSLSESDPPLSELYSPSVSLTSPPADRQDECVPRWW